MNMCNTSGADNHHTLGPGHSRCKHGRHLLTATLQHNTETTQRHNAGAQKRHWEMVGYYKKQSMGRTCTNTLVENSEQVA
jgi:hypothetical protein